MDEKYLHSQLLYEDGVNNLNRVVRLEDGSLFTLGCIYRDVRRRDRSPKHQFIFSRRSRDDGRTWDLPVFLLEIPETRYHAALLEFMISRSGALHIFMERITVYDWKNNDFQGNILYARLDDIQGSNPIVQKITCLDRYTGSMNNLIQLENGRLVVPLSTLRPGLPSFISNTLYSDDDGQTWQASNDVAVISEETHCESGAVEPVVIETAPDRLVMIIRTVLGCFYFATSTDGGATWSQAAPSHIKSSNAPAVLEKLADGRIIMAWNNCNGAPMQGVRYSFARQCLHAAVSDDGLQTLQGCRMIVKKVSGDPDIVKNCYPLASPASAGSVYLRFFTVDSRDGEDWTEPNGKLLEMPVDFLRETAFADDFSLGDGQWVTDYQATGLAGQPGRNLLRVKATNGQIGYAMTNFPFSQAGSATLTFRTAPDFAGARLILADNYLDRASFQPPKDNDPYQQYIEETYLAIPLAGTARSGALTVCPGTGGTLTLTWHDETRIVTASCGETRLELAIPQSFCGFNHLGVVVDGSGQSFDLEQLTVQCEKPGLPTGIPRMS